MNRALAAALAFLALRGLLLGVPPLTDPTESRYAMTGALMADSGNWTTPYVFRDGQPVPYWGKPPLHFWLTAASLRVFGRSAAAARLPAFLMALLCGWFTYRLARRWGGVPAAGATLLILATSGLFLVCAGASMTDMTLAALLTGVMTHLPLALYDRSRGFRTRVAMVIALMLALAVLTKGPVALVLAGLPLLLYLGLRRTWRDLGRLAWLPGLAVFTAVAAPWFVIAERATPGFLHYFFVNENLMRFVSRDYGDLYGAGHRHVPGLIWPTLVLCFLPWSVPLLARLLALGRAGRGLSTIRADDRLLYALCWGVAPALLFTVARQWLPAYLLPGLPGLALATVRLGAVKRPRTLLVTTGIVAAFLLASALVLPRFLPDRSGPGRPIPDSVRFSSH